MNFIFDKRSAKICAEQIAGRLRQFVNDMKEERKLTVSEFAEMLTFCFLNELTELNLGSNFTTNVSDLFSQLRQVAPKGVTVNTMQSAIDSQLVISASLGMQHACMQMIATNAVVEAELKAPPDPSEVEWDHGKVH